MHVVVPAGTTAMVYVPVGGAKKVKPGSYFFTGPINSIEIHDPECIK